MASPTGPTGPTDPTGPAQSPLPLPALLVVDAANVVGSVPDGWWRDRAGATRRLRDALEPLARTGLADLDPQLAPPLEVVLVVEGAARGIGAGTEVGVLDASGSGDEAMVELVRASVAHRCCVVVTADRVLRQRVSELGALVVGPRSLPHLRRR